MRGFLLAMLLAAPLWGSAAAQQRLTVHIGAASGYLDLGGEGGVFLAFGGRFSYALTQEAQGGRLVISVAPEFAGITPREDRYTYNSFANACRERATGEYVAPSFCTGAVLLGAGKVEAGYAPSFLPLTFGVGLRYGEEFGAGGNDGVVARLRPYGAVTAEASLSRRTSAVVQLDVGSDLLRVQGGVSFRIN